MKTVSPLHSCQRPVLRRTAAIAFLAFAANLSTSWTAAAQSINPQPAVAQAKIGQLEIGMPFAQAIQFIRLSLGGIVNPGTCQTRRISPLDDGFTLGDLMINCEGGSPSADGPTTNFAAVFAENRLRFVGMGTFEVHQVPRTDAGDVLHAVTRAYNVSPHHKAQSPHQRIQVFDASGRSTDTHGNSIETRVSLEISAAGTVVHATRIRLLPAQFDQYQRSRLTYADTLLSQDKTASKQALMDSQILAAR